MAACDRNPHKHSHHGTSVQRKISSLKSTDWSANMNVYYSNQQTLNSARTTQENLSNATATYLKKDCTPLHDAWADHLWRVCTVAGCRS